MTRGVLFRLVLAAALALTTGCAEVQRALQDTLGGPAASAPQEAKGAAPAGPAATPAAPAAGWDSARLDTARRTDYLSETEKDVVLEINRLRSDPARYAQALLVPRRGSFQGRIYKRPGEIDLMTDEGVAALDECIAELSRTQARSPLLPSRGLSRAASDHAADQARTGRTGHDGSDGSRTDSRISRYGRWDRSAGENISYGPSRAAEIVIQLAVDDGVRDRGHRRNLLQTGFGVIGVAVDSHPEFGTVCVMDFAGAYTDR
jgi:uncharacterized protein YkwD